VGEIIQLYIVLKSTLKNERVNQSEDGGLQNPPNLEPASPILTENSLSTEPITASFHPVLWRKICESGHETWCRSSSLTWGGGRYWDMLVNRETSQLVTLLTELHRT